MCVRGLSLCLLTELRARNRHEANTRLWNSGVLGFVAVISKMHSGESVRDGRRATRDVALPEAAMYDIPLVFRALERKYAGCDEDVRYIHMYLRPLSAIKPGPAERPTGADPADVDMEEDLGELDS